MKKSSRINIRLAEYDYKRLVKLAKKLGCGISSATRRLIVQALDRLEDKQ